MSTEPIMGFPSSSQDSYQLNVTNVLRHAARSFVCQEVVSIRPDGSKLRFTYKEIYDRVKDLIKSGGERISSVIITSGICPFAIIRQRSNNG